MKPIIERHELPPRLARALGGLVKSGIASRDEIDALVDRAVNETAGAGRQLVDYLWDAVAAIRAQAEARRARASRRYRNCRGGRSVS
ncbi:MAG TPA: hypothetical protein V6D08_20255 [Candidatus Obscuribacterales bacterium]